MRRILFVAIAALAICITSCNNGGTPAYTGNTDSTKTPKETKSERNMRIGKEITEAISKHDTANVFKYASKDFVEMGDGSMAPMKGDSAKVGLFMFLSAFPDMKAENMVITANDDVVMICAQWSGTFKGDMMGIKATNKSFKADAYYYE